MTPVKTYKIVRRPLGTLQIPKALDHLVAFLGTQAQRSLGWFTEVRVERLAGPAAKALPGLKDIAITLLELSDGARVVALATDAIPIVHVDVDHGVRLLAPSLAGFVHAWTRCHVGVPDLDHDGARIVSIEKRHATWGAGKSARPALAAWAKARGLKPVRGEAFDLVALLGNPRAHRPAVDPRQVPHDQTLEAPLAAGEVADFARYGAWLTTQGHPLGAVVSADCAAERKASYKSSAAKQFSLYVRSQLAARYARLAASMEHYTRPVSGYGLTFKFGFLWMFDSKGWTAAMREQALDLLEHDDHARWLVRFETKDIVFDDLALFSRFPALRTLSLRETRFAGRQSLAPLVGLTQLRAIDLDGSRVSDLTPLAKLPLVQLILPRTEVVDLRPLKGHPTLEHLELMDTPVQDISPLLSCKKLCNVGLWGTRVSKADAHKLVLAIDKHGARPTTDSDDLLVGYDRYVAHKDASW